MQKSPRVCRLFPDAVRPAQDWLLCSVLALFLFVSAVAADAFLSNQYNICFSAGSAVGASAVLVSSVFYSLASSGLSWFTSVESRSREVS